MATQSFTTFLLDDELFGIDILYVREINKQLDATPVPHAVDYVHGLINLRGQIVTVMDLKQRVGLGQCKLGEETHNIIIKNDTELMDLKNRGEVSDSLAVPDKVGFLVDNIRDVVTVEESEIDAVPANLGGLDKQYFTGVIKLENQLVKILSVNNILKGHE